MFEVVLPNGDRAEAATAEAALYAARTLAADATANAAGARRIQASVVVARDGMYDGRLTTTARCAR